MRVGILCRVYSPLSLYAYSLSLVVHGVSGGCLQVNEWLWGVEDPLLKWIQPDGAVVALQKNDTLHGPSLFDTGKRDYTKVCLGLTRV